MFFKDSNITDSSRKFDSKNSNINENWSTKTNKILIKRIYFETPKIPPKTLLIPPRETIFMNFVKFLAKMLTLITIMINEAVNIIIDEGNFSSERKYDNKLSMTGVKVSAPKIPIIIDSKDAASIIKPLVKPLNKP